MLCCLLLACPTATTVGIQGEENIETFSHGAHVYFKPEFSSRKLSQYELTNTKVDELQHLPGFILKSKLQFLTDTELLKKHNSYRQPEMQTLVSALRFFIIPLLGKIYCQLCAPNPTHLQLPSGSGTALACIGFPRDLRRLLKNKTRHTRINMIQNCPDKQHIKVPLQLNLLKEKKK